MKKKSISFGSFLIIPSLLLVLEALPFGVVLNFANPEGAPWRSTYSYFDLTPFGYAMFPPFLIALSTCAILILTVVYTVRQRKELYHAIATISAVALGLSLAQLMYGLDFVTAISILVPILLLLHLGLFAWKGKSQK